MQRSNPSSPHSLKSKKQNYLLNYDYSGNEFIWDVANLGEIDNDDLQQLCQQLIEHDNIIHLDLSSNGLGKSEGLIFELMNLLKCNPQLEYINLSDNDLEDKHLKIVREAPSSCWLRHQTLNLSNNSKLTMLTLDVLEDICDITPTTIMTLISGNNYFKDNANEKITHAYSNAVNEQKNREEEEKVCKENIEKTLKNPKSFSSEEFYWDANLLGSADPESIKKLSLELKKYNNVTGVSFFVSDIGKKSGSIGAVIELLKENPQINTIDLTMNAIRDHQIERIVASLSHERLKNLYLVSRGNMVTKRGLMAVHEVMAPATAITMGTSNNMGKGSDPEVVRIVEEARAEYNKLKADKQAAPIAATSNFFPTVKKEEQAADLQSKEKFYEEKTNESSFNKPGLNNSK